jgi:signal transduction histidine kinase
LQNHVDFEISLNLPKSFPSLPNNVAVAAFRIYQEAMTNVVKHAEAGRVLVKLTVDNQRLNVVVEDDGNGLVEVDGSSADTGSGVLGMRERTEDLGGTFSLTSTEQGTTVSATLPVSG